MPGPLRRLFKIPHLKCSLCTRRFRNAAGLANHFNAAHARAEGHNVSAGPDIPENGLHGDEFNLPQDDGEEMAAEEPFSHREYHPVLDGELYFLSFPECQILICARYTMRRIWK